MKHAAICIALSSKTNMNMSLVWVYSGVFSPFVVSLVGSDFTVEDNVRNSFIRSGK